MPTRALSPCAHAGCNALVRSRRCDRHVRTLDKARGSARKRGYGTWWDKARKRHLFAHPLCVHCQREGRTEPAVVVDHIIPHRGDDSLLRDPANWQSLCVRHHNIKTASGQ